MFSLTDYNYDLPADLIAQQPAAQRDHANLLCLNRQSGELSHHRFDEIVSFLNPGDVLVINNTAVIPGRLTGRKESGGRVEVLVSGYVEDRNSRKPNGHPVCRCMVKASKRPAAGTWLHFEAGLKARVLDSRNGTHILEFYGSDDFETLLDRIGQVPLPPYIKRAAGNKPPCNDRSSYQTVYARHKGAIAAPTAGLHFTRELLDRLKTGGVRVVPLTLHVGYGTFLPVRVSDIRSHQMHTENFRIPQQSAATINTARSQGRRVVAVGTTCVRTLEYATNAAGQVAAGSGDCDLFIYPGYRFKVVDALITNFHLPKSTLLMLVAAFAGRQTILEAYRQAVKSKYRFFSYGDAMLIV
jgi:S-adenosylmethionine:tRNA ribosyltransferase-isomerase